MEDNNAGTGDHATNMQLHASRKIANSVIKTVNGFFTALQTSNYGK